MFFSNADVIQVFNELPNHRGCSDDELNAAEKQLNVRLPAVYRSMMQLDADRLVSAGLVAPIEQLEELRTWAFEALIEEDFEFRLSADDVVFLWEPASSFFFFRANEATDPPVKSFCFSEGNGLPHVLYDSLTEFFGDRLKQYLRL